MSSSSSSSSTKLTTDESHAEVPVPVSQERDKESTPLEPNSDSEDKEEDNNEPTTEETTPAPDATAQWQAVWSSDYNAYYFFNAATQQTTWTNPLVPEGASASASTDTQQQQASTAAEVQEQEQEDEPEPSSSSSARQPPMSAVAVQNAAIEAAALAQGIDPLLARLDPSLVASATAPGQSVPGCESSLLKTLPPSFPLRSKQTTH